MQDLKSAAMVIAALAFWAFITWALKTIFGGVERGQPTYAPTAPALDSAPAALPPVPVTVQILNPTTAHPALPPPARGALPGMCQAGCGSPATTTAVMPFGGIVAVCHHCATTRVPALPGGHS